VQEQRKKIWIDRFQTYLSVRLALYFVLYQAAVWALVLIEKNIFAVMEDVVGPGGGLGVFLVLVGVVVVVGLLFIYDAIKLTHRIVGPLYRIRKTLQAVAAGEEMDLVKLREGDLLQELKDDLNEMLKVLEQRGAVSLKSAETKQPVSV
jgi:sensor histidine kinase YesM